MVDIVVDHRSFVTSRVALDPTAFGYHLGWVIWLCYQTVLKTKPTAQQLQDDHGAEAEALPDAIDAMKTLAVARLT